jgi:hypothetical protein
MAGQVTIDQLPPPDSGQPTVDQLPPPPKAQPGIIGTIGGIAQAAGSGINALVPDTLGLPMDTSVNIVNLAKAGAGYTVSKVTGKAPPAWSEPRDPATVWGTSEWLTKQAERVTGPGVFEPRSRWATQHPTAAGITHMVGEAVGPPTSVGVRAVTAEGKVIRAIDAEDAEVQAAKPRVRVVGTDTVSGKPRVRVTEPQAQAAVRSAMHEVHQQAAPPALVSALKRAGRVPTTEKLEKALHELLVTVSPESLGATARKAAAVVGSRLAVQAREHARWDFQSNTRLKYWLQAGPQKAADLIHGYERGAMPAAEHAEYAAHYRRWNEQILAQDKRNGIEYTPTENYLSHAFMDQKGAEAWLTKRFGTRWYDPGFTKDREFQLYAEAANAGFKLRYGNPEEIMLARQAASDRAEAQINALEDMEQHGLASTEAKNPFTAATRRRAPNGKMYWVQNDAEVFLHKAFDEKGLWSDEGVRGQVFRGMMALKNTAVSSRLALSGFHALHVLHIDNAAYAANAYKEVLAGGRSALSALREQLKSALLYRSFWENPRVGGRIRAAYRGQIPASQLSSTDAQLLSDMTDGGFVPEMSSRYRDIAENSFRKAISDHSVSAVWKLPGAMMQTLSKPLFEWWIPNLKAASYANEVRSWRALNPDLADDTIARQQAFRRIAKSIDNRYGEMNYDQLFWNHYVKDLSTLNTLSLGWQLGFLREFGGGAMDLGQFALSREGKLAQVAEGKLDRPLFSAQYLTSAALYGGLLTWALSGEKPKSLTDYIYPVVGKNPDGTPQRVSTMFYTREIAGLWDHMRKQGVLSGLTQLAENKSSGVIGLIDQWATGLNDYGQEYRDPAAPAMQKLQQTLAYTLKSFEPISLEGTKGQPTRERLLSAAGFRPAPRYVTESVTESRIWDAYDKYVQPREQPFESVQKQQELRQLRTLWEQRSPQAEVLLRSIADRYQMTGAEVRKTIKSLNSPETGSQHAFQALPWQVQKRLLDDMSAKDREHFLPFSNKQHLRDRYRPS